jgi:IS30 family transposase
MNKTTYQRLTPNERKVIEHALNGGESLKSIAAGLGRSTSTVSREVGRNSRAERGGSERKPFNNCLHRETCREHDICTKEDCKRDICPGCVFCIHVCKKYVREECPSVSKPPYVCNSCKRRRNCTLEKFFYRARPADRAAKELLAETRRGILLDEAERKRISDIVSPLIKQGQSPYHICLTNKDALMISDKTLYKYITLGLTDAKNTDLLRKVKMKPRKEKPRLKVEKACYAGRTYRDFLARLETDPDVEVVQTDTVIGKKGGGEKCFLTVCFPKSELMLAFIRDANTAKSVTDVFDALKSKLGFKLFEEIFPLILTDRGSEFSAPSAIETDDASVLWTSIFYCDPNCAYQKPEIESGHRLIRTVLPKGTSFNPLTQEDVDLMMSHINSYARKALGGRTPIGVFAQMHGNTVIRQLGLRLVPTNEINLTPSLLK